jgi:hypothetical protein
MSDLLQVRGALAAYAWVVALRPPSNDRGMRSPGAAIMNAVLVGVAEPHLVDLEAQLSR